MKKLEHFKINVNVSPECGKTWQALKQRTGMTSKALMEKIIKESK